MVGLTAIPNPRRTGPRLAEVLGGTALVSIDCDFFARPEEQALSDPLYWWFADQVEAGVPVHVHDDHLALVGLVDDPVDVVINLDFHLDCRVEFLHGAPALDPPQDATVFETLLASGRVGTYGWAHPGSRRHDAALVYASAVVTDRQPLLRRIHCLPGSYVVNELLQLLDVRSVFVCRSPGYATPATDLVFERLAELVATRGARIP